MKSKSQKDSLFIPFNYIDHKSNKIRIVKTELSVLKCLKIIENLKSLHEKKAELRKELEILNNENKALFNLVFKSMPSVPYPKMIIEPNEIETKEISSKTTSNLARELGEIELKLKKLSAYQ